MTDFRIKVFSGVRWNTAATVLKAVIYPVQMIVLARYLQPADFGLMAIIHVVIGLSLLVMDLGVSNVIIQRQDITERQLSSLFWLNLLSGIFIAVILYASSPGLANLYNNVKLQQLLHLTAGLFLIVPLGLQFSALMQKQLRFKAVSVIDGLSVLSNLTISIYLAAEGYGVYSLMAGTISQYIVATLLYVLLGIKLSRPKFSFSWVDIKPFVSFGYFQTASGLLSYLNFQLDVIMIGKLFSPELLGLYSISKNIAIKPLELINPAVIRVSYPVLSKYQMDPKKHRDIYLNLVNNLSSITFPVYIIFYLMSEPIITLLLGEKWMAAVPLLRIMAVYSMARSAWQPSGPLLLSRGRADLQFYWSLFLLAVIFAAVSIGSNWGIIGSALCIMSFQVLALFPNFSFWIKAVATIGFKEYGRSLSLPFLLAAASGIIAKGVVYSFPSNVVSVTIFTTIFTAVYYYFCIRFNRVFVENIGELISPVWPGKTLQNPS